MSVCFSFVGGDDFRPALGFAGGDPRMADAVPFTSFDSRDPVAEAGKETRRSAASGEIPGRAALQQLVDIYLGSVRRAHHGAVDRRGRSRWGGACRCAAGADRYRGDDDCENYSRPPALKPPRALRINAHAVARVQDTLVPAFSEVFGHRTPLRSYMITRGGLLRRRLRFDARWSSWYNDEGGGSLPHTAK